MPFSALDPRINALRAQALHYPNIVEYLKQRGHRIQRSRLFRNYPTSRLSLSR
ncbi:MAG: hypothetical protein ACREAY_00860 [Nitrososphaera sp.]|uniref:hypothetical protein n=1 Tax=Nitrososphaera sp. TaxID=1971748 RepID=UPI003D6FE9A5